RTSYCPKSNCRPAHCRWALRLPKTERSFTSQQVAETQLRLSIRRRMTSQPQSQSETAPGESRSIRAVQSSTPQTAHPMTCRLSIKSREKQRGGWGWAAVGGASRSSQRSAGPQPSVFVEKGRLQTPPALISPRQRNWDIARATRAIAGLLPPCCPLGEMQPRL